MPSLRSEFDLAAASAKRCSATNGSPRGRCDATREAMRLGVLTAGGDCPGVNAVIRAVVRSAESCFGENRHRLPPQLE